MSFKFRKHQRIKSPAEFQEVYKNRQWGNTRCLTFNAQSISTLDTCTLETSTLENPASQNNSDNLNQANHTNQLGVTVSKKVSKLAVRRNQLKRLVREFYRHNQHEIANTKLVVTVKPAARDISNQEMAAELQELWIKLKKWRRWADHQEKPLSRKPENCKPKNRKSENRKPKNPKALSWQMFHNSYHDFSKVRRHKWKRLLTYYFGFTT